MEETEDYEDVRIAFLEIQANLILGKDLEKNIMLLTQFIDVVNHEVDTHPNDPDLLNSIKLGYEIFRLRDLLYKELLNQEPLP
jgi:hypothetical protein